MPQVTWTEAALADIQRHYETLELIDMDVAIRAVQAIRKAGDLHHKMAYQKTLIDLLHE